MGTAKIATMRDNLMPKYMQSTREKFIRNAYWISGANSKNAALEQYDLLRTGYVRIFILQMPKFMEELLPDETEMFKHMLEFANVGVDGIQGYSAETTQATGGYAGSSIELPTGTKDDTSSITIKVYETRDSLVRTYIDTWMTGTFDPQTNLNHYHGLRDILKKEGNANYKNFYFSQANHTMEALIVATDPTGDNANYTCLTTNMYPKGSDHGHFNFDPGSHDLVQVSMEFTANKYMGSQINYLGKTALQNFKILKNFMLTYSGYTEVSNKTLPGTSDRYNQIQDWELHGKDGEINKNIHNGNGANVGGLSRTEARDLYGLELDD